MIGSVMASFSDFSRWKLRYNVVYDSLEEELYRERIFQQNLARALKEMNLNHLLLLESLL